VLLLHYCSTNLLYLSTENKLTINLFLVISCVACYLELLVTLILLIILVLLIQMLTPDYLSTHCNKVKSD